jgi:hypothetical protein
MQHDLPSQYSFKLINFLLCIARFIICIFLVVTLNYSSQCFLACFIIPFDIKCVTRLTHCLAHFIDFTQSVTAVKQDIPCFQACFIMVRDFPPQHTCGKSLTPFSGRRYFHTSLFTVKSDMFSSAV